MSGFPLLTWQTLLPLQLYYKRKSTAPEQEVIPDIHCQNNNMAKNHNKYRKDKPWDTEDIDHWKLEEWNPDNLKGNLLEESSFATLFPKYREKYLRDVWPVVTKCLEVRLD